MEIPYEKTLADLFRWRVSVSGDDIAHKFIDNETTYSELDKYANKVALGLISLDCKPDSRVAFLGKNSDQLRNQLLRNSFRDGTERCMK